jgi:hypothetical protein
MSTKVIVEIAIGWYADKISAGAKEIGVGSDSLNYKVILMADRAWRSIPCSNRGEMERVRDELHRYIGGITVPIRTRSARRAP